MLLVYLLVFPKPLDELGLPLFCCNPLLGKYPPSIDSWFLEANSFLLLTNSESNINHLFTFLTFYQFFYYQAEIAAQLAVHQDLF